MATLTYKALQDAVLGRRFPAASQRENAKRWIDTAYADVWNALRGEGRYWTFELVFRSTLTVTSGDSTPAMPADYGDTVNLLDDEGNELARLSPEDFDREFHDLTETGTPYAFTVVDRQIHLGPTPDASVSFTHTYRRRLSHKADGSTVTAGPMNSDNDTPLWDDHHSVLIPRATALGLQEINDPTWQPLQEEYERQLSRMKEDYEQVRPRRQWAAASWR